MNLRPTSYRSRAHFLRIAGLARAAGFPALCAEQRGGVNPLTAMRAFHGSILVAADKRRSTKGFGQSADSLKRLPVFGAAVGVGLLDGLSGNYGRQGKESALGDVRGDGRFHAGTMPNRLSIASTVFKKTGSGLNHEFIPSKFEATF